MEEWRIGSRSSDSSSGSSCCNSDIGGGRGCCDDRGIEGLS